MAGNIQLANEINNSVDVVKQLSDIIEEHLIIGGQVMDGIEFIEGFQVRGARDIIENKDKIVSITDSTVTTMPCYSTFAGMSNLREIHMPNLETTTNGDGNTFAGCVSLDIVDMPKLTSFGGRIGLSSTSLTTINLPKLASLTSISLQGASRLVEVNLSSLVDGFGSNGLASSGVPLRINYHNYKSGFINSGSSSTGFHSTRDCQFLDVTNVSGWNVNMLQNNRYPVNLIDFRIGAGMTTSFALLNYYPTNAMRFDTDSLLTDEDRQAGFTSNGEKLLYNLKHYFADNLQDRTDEEYATVTLHQDLYNFIDTYGQDIVETVENKNWYLIS